MESLRFLHSKLFANKNMVKMSPIARYLYLGLICFADKAGRMEDDPMMIKGQILAYDDISKEEVNQLLSDLEKNKFIIRYEADGNRYIQVVNFTKYQPNLNEEESVIPCPEGYVPPSTIVHVSKLTKSVPKAPSKKSNEGSHETDEKPLYSLPLKDGTFFNVYQELYDSYKNDFPDVDLDKEFARMRRWLTDNPVKGKTRTGIRRFITNWVERCKPDYEAKKANAALFEDIASWLN